MLYIEYSSKAQAKRNYTEQELQCMELITKLGYLLLIGNPALHGHWDSESRHIYDDDIVMFNGHTFGTPA